MKDEESVLTVNLDTAVYKTVEYFWVDELIDHITPGLHDCRENMTLTVYWKCGICTIIETGIDPEKDNPEKLWETDRRSREKQERGKKNADLL